MKTLVNKLLQTTRSANAVALARGTVANLLFSVFSTAASFATAILLARILGAAGFGEFSVAMTWATVMVAVAKLGFEQTIMMNASRYDAVGDMSRLRGLVRFSLLGVAVASLGAIVISVLLVAHWGLLTEGTTNQTLWAAFAIVPLYAFLAWAAAFQLSRSQMFRAQISTAILAPALLLGALLSFDAVSLGTSPAAAMTIQLGATVVAAAVSLWLLFRTFPGILRGPAIFEASLWAKGVTLVAVANGLYLLSMNLDLLFVGSVLGKTNAAHTKVATRGADLVAYALLIINLPFGPLVARLNSAKTWRP